MFGSVEEGKGNVEEGQRIRCGRVSVGRVVREAEGEMWRRGVRQTWK